MNARAMALLAAVGAAAAQGGVGNLPAAGACNFNTLSARVAALNAQCSSSGGGGELTCTIACSSVLLPLLDECRPLLDVLLDTDDGVRDGIAGQLDTLRTQCRAIPSGDVLAELKTMHDAGTCPDSALDGVA